MQLFLSTLFFLLLAAAGHLTSATKSHIHLHNITHILSDFTQFSTFNHYLTTTHLASEINSRETITVCAIDNAAMNALLAKHYPIQTLKNILSLHVLLDYFGAKKLHQIRDGSALAATMYQATGSAPGSAGFVNITDMKGGKVGFTAKDDTLADSKNVDATFVKSVKEFPYDLAIIQISHVLSSPDAAAPAPAPEALNLTQVMSAHGCKVFGDTLNANKDAMSTYMSNADGGLTIFCPGDEAMKNFLPKYKNLTADGKLSLLLFHATPTYETVSMLKSSNGMMNTLATDGAKKFDFEVQNDDQDVTLKTKLVTARITEILVDEQPLAIYSIDKVLLPKELFKGDIAPAPAPAPGKGKGKGKGKGSKHHPASPPAPPGDAASSPSDSPADSPDDGPAADDNTNEGVRLGNGLWSMVLMSLGSLVVLDLQLKQW